MRKLNVKEALIEARENRRAIPAFNIFNYISAQGVIEAANEMELPVILQTSTGTVKKFGIHAMIQMLKPLMDDSRQDIFLNLDHCTSLQFAKECADAGWDMVMFDGSKLTLEENIRKSREMAEYASERGVFVEGELGTIAGVEEEIVAGESKLASLKECQIYLENSGIHIFAPAVGTAHGMYHGVPKLDFDLVSQLRNYSDTPVVIHGGTGLSKEEFQTFIQNGACKINISTAIKHAYLDGMDEYLSVHKNEYNPLDADDYVRNEIKEAAKRHMEMFQL